MLTRPDRSSSVLHRLREMRFDIQEASGAVGDLGTFIPLAASMIVVCQLDAGSVLFFAGLFNIVTGVIFNQPIPVQPMKAIAAVAVAEFLAPGAIAAAGLGVAAVLLLLAATGLVEVLEKWIPLAVVRGIQLGVGLKLTIKGLEMVRATPPLAADGWLMALAATVVTLFALRYRRFPAALVLFLAGLAWLAVSPQAVLWEVGPGWQGFVLTVPVAEEWWSGLLRGTVPQLTLTLLNSVIAVCALSSDLYPGRGIGTRSMALSVASMNLVGCWFGAMPMCHGSGGLAGQHHFGARTGGSVVMLGVVKIVLALTLGAAATTMLAVYPPSILGVLLTFAGLELSLPARSCTSRRDFLVAAITAGGVLGIHTTAGVLLGLLVALVLPLGESDET